MKMTKTETITFFNLIISNHGRPSDEELINNFGMRNGAELSRQLNIGNFAVYTDNALFNMAEKAKKRLENS